MKKRVMMALVTAILIGSSAMATEKGSYIALGYGSTTINETTKAAPIVEVGFKIGQTYKHVIASRLIFSGENDDWTDGKGNVGEFYYSLGYDLLKDTTLSAKIGYAFEDLGTSHKVTSYAGGVSYGVMAKYALSDSFDIVASYTHASLEYISLDYSVDVADVSLSYTF